MTRKHFQELADMIRTQPLSDQLREELAKLMADYCARQNGRFDRARFLTACGVS